MGNKEPVVSTEYVLTASVKANLKDLGRVVSARYLFSLSIRYVFLIDLQNVVVPLRDWQQWR